MNDDIKITGRLVAAARMLTGVSQADVANAAGIPPATYKRMEASGAAPVAPAAAAQAVRHALEGFGAIFLPESGGAGAGVRLKFTRLDARQLSRLEGEGGPIRDDDVP
ncbi:MAG: helix-turn-helix domain-containing protein [Pseudorhodoplanes sp.]